MLVEERGFHSFREPFCQVVVQGADLGRRNTLVSRKGRFKDVDLGEKKKVPSLVLKPYKILAYLPQPVCYRS